MIMSELKFTSVYETENIWVSEIVFISASMTVLLEYSTADKLFCSELDPGFWKTRKENTALTNCKYS